MGNLVTVKTYRAENINSAKLDEWQEKRKEH